MVFPNGRRGLDSLHAAIRLSDEIPHACELILKPLPRRDPSHRWPEIMEGLESRHAEKAGGVGESSSVQTPFPHARKIHVSTRGWEVQIARPEERIDVEIDDDGLTMDSKCLWTRLHRRRGIARGRFDIDEEEDDQKD